MQILHSRDPDSSCDIVVYIDGVRATDVEVEDIDPGRGHSAADWQERIDSYSGDTTEFGQTAQEWLIEAADSKYIESED